MKDWFGLSGKSKTSVIISLNRALAREFPGVHFVDEHGEPLGLERKIEWAIRTVREQRDEMRAMQERILRLMNYLGLDEFHEPERMILRQRRRPKEEGEKAKTRPAKKGGAD